MTEKDELAERFQENRPRLKAVACRILGSPGDAEDAVQEAWLRLTRTDASQIGNLGGWLTTVVARVCLDMLRTRKTRKEEPLEETPGQAPPDPRAADPEEEALLADSLGSALLIVLRTLTPSERVAFVLHDLFALSFAEIAPVLGRSETAARQLASRARRRVQGDRTRPEDQARKREIVTAFLAASREGNFDALLLLLDPRIRLYADDTAVKTAAANKGKGAPPFENEMQGARSVAEAFKGRAVAAQLALIDGSIGTTWILGGKPRVAFLFHTGDGVIQEIDVVMDPEELAGLEVKVLDGKGQEGL
jgi:RNA polymerase sigma-70 factor, ECF subfamily